MQDIIPYIISFLSTKKKLKISFFQNFISFYFILLKKFRKFFFVMNSVHEQCPNSDSKTVLSPKIGWVHQVHSLLAQLAHPGALRRAQARARGRVVAPPTDHVAGLQRRVAGPSQPCRGCRAPCHRRAPGRVVGTVAVSQYSPCPASCSLVTIHFSVL